MKGYLERLASQAIRPRGGIHPMVGSIYAGSQLANLNADLNSEPALTEKEQLVVKPRRDFVEREDGEWRPAHGRVQGEIAEGRVVRADAPESKERKPVQPGTVFEPLVIRAQHEREHLPIRAEAAESEPAARQNRSAQEAKQAADPQKSYTPLRAPDGRPVIVTRSVAKEDAPIRAAAGGREEQPIEIHIGRIEVTAVPETQRPAAARTRKSLDLTEYLKRRDGRAG